MKYIVYLFFRYHSNLTQKNIAYDRSLLCLLFLIYINCTSIALFFWPIPARTIFLKNRIYTCSILIVLFVVGMYVVKKFITKEELNHFMPSSKVKFHGWLLFSYILLSLSFMVVSMIVLKRALILY